MSGTMPALLVLGASGAIGRGVVAAVVAAGRPVIAVARSRQGLEALREAHPSADLTLLPACLGSDHAAAELAQHLRATGRSIGGVVAAICGGATRGRLLDQPAEFLRHRLDEDLLPHLFAARRLLPLLAEDPRGGGYVLIGGPGGEQPWAGYGHRSIATAALRMLARVLHDEARALGVRVQLLTVDSPARTDTNADHACQQWPSALSIGRRALALIGRDTGDGALPAVVRHVQPSAPSALWSDDIDVAPPRRVRAAVHESDSDAALLPARCLQDARTLLHSVLDAQHGSARPAQRRAMPALPPSPPGRTP